MFFGYLFGIANIIPGVSGGTFALIFGFYERLLNIINSLNSELIKESFEKLKALLLQREWNEFSDFLDKKDLWFGVKLGVGAIFAIGSLSALMKYLLQVQFSITYAFFFGLIFTSVIVPFKKIKNKKSLTSIAFLVGVALTIGVSASVNPIDKIAQKSVIYKTKFESQDLIQEKSLAFVGKYSTEEYLIVFVAAMLAVSAMVLPGVSGSLVLIMLGQYFTVITAIANLKSMVLDEFVLLSIFATGMLIGMLLISRAVAWALESFHDTTMYLLTGLITGSFYALWPFKEKVVLAIYEKTSTGIKFNPNKEIYSNVNLWPDASFESLWVVLAMGAGIATMHYLGKLEPSA